MCNFLLKFEQPICNHHDHPMATVWNIYVQTLSQSNFHHYMEILEIHYLSVHWTWTWSSHFNYKALIGVWHLATKAKVKVIICLFLLFSKLLFFTTMTLHIFLCQHAHKRSSARNASSSIKTPWVLEGASSYYHSLITYS